MWCTRSGVFFDSVGVRTILADIGRHTLEGHDGHGTSFFSNACLIGVDHVHDDTTLEVLGKTRLEDELLAKLVHRVLLLGRGEVVGEVGSRSERHGDETDRTIANS